MGRRGKNEGSIYQRADGTWVASLNLGHIDGKRKRKVAYAHTRREAAEKLREMQRQIDQGVNLAAEKQTVAQFLTYWLDNHVVGCVADSTAQRTEQIIRLHLSPAIGHIDLQKLSPQHIQTMIAGFKKKRAPGTVRLYYGVLHNALDRAVKLGLLPRNPTDAVEPPPAGESPGKSMSREHEAAVLAFLEREGHRLTELVRIAIKTGMRQGELLDLHWSDINFDKGELRIRKGKTKSSRRTLSLSGEIIASLRRQWEFQKLERMGNRDKWKEHGLVFPTSSGRPMAGSHLDISWHTIQKNAGIPDSEHYRWHDLRHTATTRFAEAGVPPGVAMKILGHSTITTTMNIYSHVGDESQRNAFEKIADLGA